MELKLNDSEVIEILSLIDQAISDDILEPMEIATFKNVVKKINDQIQYKHHNEIDEFVVAINNVHFAEEN